MGHIPTGFLCLNDHGYVVFLASKTLSDILKYNELHLVAHFSEQLDLTNHTDCVWNIYLRYSWIPLGHSLNHHYHSKAYYYALLQSSHLAFIFLLIGIMCTFAMKLQYPSLILLLNTSKVFQSSLLLNLKFLSKCGSPHHYWPHRCHQHRL